jgi:hypothetical protein
MYDLLNNVDNTTNILDRLPSVSVRNTTSRRNSWIYLSTLLYFPQYIYTNYVNLASTRATMGARTTRRSAHIILLPLALCRRLCVYYANNIHITS